MKRIIRGFYKSIALHLAPKIIHDVQADSLTFLDQQALVDLHRTVRVCEQKKLPGILIEAGCAAGGSAIVMTSAKRMSRQLFVYDIFGMIPEPSEKDGLDLQERYQVIKKGEAKGIGDREYHGYESDLLNSVQDSFSKHGYPVGKNNVMLVKGLFADTINGSEPVALAHLDGDWYSSVMVCLERIVPRLVAGGTLVIDDYDAWSGCRTAVDEYFADKKKDFAFVKKARLNIVRIGS